MQRLSRPDLANGLHRRDIWLLPLVSIVTVVMMLIGAEIVGRIIWPEDKENACRVQDPVLGYRFRANCTSLTKAAEGPWVTNSYNACGYRSPSPCGPTPPGTLRVAMIGTSLTEGYLVPYEDTVGAKLGTDLARSCEAPVQVQNLGGLGYSGYLMADRMTEAVGLHPDAIVSVLGPADLEEALNHPAPAPAAAAAKSTEPAAAPPNDLQKKVFETLKSSRAVVVAQHFLFRNASIYLPLYLQYGDRADFLRPPLSPKWTARIQAFDALLGVLSQQAHAAGIRLTIAFVPQEAQLALMAGRPIPPGIDPDLLPRTLQAIAASHDVEFVDGSIPLRAQPTPERLFYQVDGHLSGRGQPIVADYIAAKMIEDPHGAFTRCHPFANAGGAARG